MKKQSQIKIPSLRATKGRAAIQNCMDCFVVKTPRNDQPKERGAVFVYILMAVVLFAALTYAMSRGNRGGTSTLTDQQAKLAAQEIIDYGNTVASAVQKLRLRGCTDTEISFANDIYKTQDGTIMQPNGHNSNTPADGSCEIYKATGANINPWEIPNYATYQLTLAPTDSNFGVINANKYPIPGIGDVSEDLLLIGFYIKKAACLKINNLLNINNPSNAIPRVISGASIFNGGYADAFFEMTDIDGVITGKTAFCATTSGPEYGFFFQVLISR